jgi:hypothetical protein
VGARKDSELVWGAKVNKWQWILQATPL